MSAGKRAKGDCCAGSRPCDRIEALPNGLPVVEVGLSDEVVGALVDTGCSTTIVASWLAGRCSGVTTMVAFDGREVQCGGTKFMKIQVGDSQIKVKVIVSDSIIDGVGVILGMDAISQLGGVMISGNKVKFGTQICASGRQLCVTENRNKPGPEKENASLTIEDKDFQAIFHGGKWTVTWLWKNGEPPKSLRNAVSCYESTIGVNEREAFEKEIDRWIEEGIIVPWKEEVERGVLPLMAVVQPTKNKVRPVLDFRELNEYVDSHTGDGAVDVCSETLRNWRRMNGAATIIDLKSAYLQIRVAESLWKYQLVRYKGKTYCLTRLGFGLNAAPRIMTVLLKTVLGKDKRVQAATDSYIDDILVDETVVTASEVADHLKKFGLVTKPPEPLDGGTALGLKLRRDKRGELVFHRGNEIPELRDTLSRRELFSLCGKLVGHYPVAGWLRVASSYIKRSAEGVNWEDDVGERAHAMMCELLDKVRKEDPVKGKWYVPAAECGVVWCDASSLATGVVLEIGGNVVEDAAWLRKKNDYSHINVAELDAVLKGINMALKWGLREMKIRTDSVTVLGWLKTVTTAQKRVRTKGAAEMVIKRRLGILGELREEFQLQLEPVFVPSAKNKADVLTRVKRTWLESANDAAEAAELYCAATRDLKQLHSLHHSGVERTLFLARKVDPSISKKAVRQVVRECVQCQSIDPAPSVHEPGEIHVESNWERLAIDVTHYRGGLYISMVDCGPGRFAVWRELRTETANEIASVLNDVFLERGPVSEVLMDNSSSFRSHILKEMLNKWNVQQRFRAAYRPGGNGIVERHHRTIKAMAERGNVDPREAVYWYNSSPRVGQDERTVPQLAVFKYMWRHPCAMPTQIGDGGASSLQIGEEVWVKPPNAHCTTKWGKGRVTDVHSQNNVSVDGMPRHILDIRRVVTESDGECSGNEQEVNDNQGPSEQGQQWNNEEMEDDREPRRSNRVQRLPTWTKDYEME